MSTGPGFRLTEEQIKQFRNYLQPYTLEYTACSGRKDTFRIRTDPDNSVTLPAMKDGLNYYERHMPFGLLRY